MVLRTIANKVGTFEVNGNAVSYLQPLSTFNTQEMDLIQKWYKEKMHALQKCPNVVPANDITFQSGQVCFSYDVTGYRSFNALKTMYLEEKLPYYLSLIDLAKNKELTLLWNAQNMVIDQESQSVKVLVIESRAFDIANESSALNAVKELIIISLTGLDQVYGRPKRSDFLEQNEEVIQFAEMIYLRLNSLDHMKEYIETVNRETIERKQQEQEEMDKIMANKKSIAFLQHIPFRFPKSMKSERILGEQRVKNQASKNNVSTYKKNNNKRFLIGTVAIVVVAIMLNLVLTNANKNAQSEVQPLITSDQESSLEKVYLQGLLGETVDVMATLQEKEYDSLSEDQKTLLHQLWMEHGQYNQLFERDEQAVSHITEYLTDKNRPEELDRLQELVKVENPHIAFAKGVLENEPDAIINNRNIVELTEGRINLVVKALLEKDEIDTAKEFVSDKAPKDDGLMDAVLTAEKNAVELKALEEQRVLLQKTIEESKDLVKVSEAIQKMNVVKKEINNLKQTKGL